MRLLDAMDDVLDAFEHDDVERMTELLTASPVLLRVEYSYGADTLLHLAVLRNKVVHGSMLATCGGTVAVSDCEFTSALLSL